MNYPTKQQVYEYIEKLQVAAEEQWLQAADANDYESAAWLEEVIGFFFSQKRAIARLSTVPYRAWCNWWVREIEPHMPALS